MFSKYARVTSSRPFQFEHDAITFGLIVVDGHG
jgi:hypothetical protein